MAKKARFRADELIFAQGLAESRSLAASLVMAGRVTVTGEGPEAVKVATPGQPFPETAQFAILPGRIWAGRGALKLLTIMDSCQLDVTGQVCIDAGASTGGFTDCLLARGAARVYAIDVGKNLLHEKLLADPRVHSIEGVNLRMAPPDLIPEKASFLVADLSFISLTACVPSFLPWLANGASLVFLVKPQFELPPHEVGNGIVRNEALRLKALRKVIDFCEKECGLRLLSSLPSAIKGAKGNQEYLTLFQKD